MRLTVAAVGLVAALVVSGCGGDDSGSPVAPSAPIPQFAGTWAGNLNVTSRTATDGVRELNPDLDCDSLADCGNWLPVSAEFTQSGRAVSGTVSTTFNEPPQFEWESQTGTIDGAGTLRMTFQAAAAMSEGVNVTYNLTGWESRIDGTVMTGMATMEITVEGVTGASTNEICLGADNTSCSGLQRQ